MLEVVAATSLEGMFALPGPSRPEGSIAEPLRLGMREDGSYFETADRAHAMEMGMSGSGKTVAGLVAAYERLTRRDVVQLDRDRFESLVERGRDDVELAIVVQVAQRRRRGDQGTGLEAARPVSVRNQVGRPWADPGDDRPGRTAPLGAAQGDAALDAAADDKRPVAQLGTVALLHGGVEGIHVDVDDLAHPPIVFDRRAGAERAGAGRPAGARLAVSGEGR